MIFADKIIALRKKNNWSQEQLANELGVSRQSVSKWESAMSIPDLDKIIKLSALFGVSTDYLLKDELEEESISETIEQDGEELRRVSAEEADAYMKLVEKISGSMAAAVSLLIFSPIPLLVLAGTAEYQGTIKEDFAAGIGVSILLAIIVVGVMILVLNGMKLSQYEYLEKEVLTLQYGVEGIVKKKKAEFESRFRSSIAIGVGLCIAGVIPIFVAMGLEMNDFAAVCMVCVLLFCVSIAVFLFIHTGMIYESYQKLLQQGEYTTEEKLLNKKLSFFPGIYWCIVTAVFLGISFWYNNWDRSWIIWPVAGVAFAALFGIFKAITKWKSGR